MKPEKKSQSLLGVTRAKAKMLEFGVPRKYHIKIPKNPEELFPISIALLGDLAASINCGNLDSELLHDLKSNLLFSAQFFDSYFHTRLNIQLDSYLMFLGAAAYYLCDLPGSASVLVRIIDDDSIDLESDGLSVFLLWLLRSDFYGEYNGAEGPFSELLDTLSQKLSLFFIEISGDAESILELAKKLRTRVYNFNSPRALLFGDVIAAIIKRKIENSTIKTLPLYSNQPLEKWLTALEKKSFIKELWPAQHLIGQAGVLKGMSAIIQLPTSAGKTKATELILRSAFNTNRVSLSIIIAPFRALCHEIKDDLVKAFQNEPIIVEELSDLNQTDFEIHEIISRKNIIVVTPEKLLYALRQFPELASHVGQIVFDEGHQFDNGIRGITYELLLTSLNTMISEGTQKILISAVISNAAAVGQWLNDSSLIIEGGDLSPTFRSIGFASWLDTLGRIEYVYNSNPNQNDFFVPRVIESNNLGRQGREQQDRYFPEKNDSNDVALFLGLKLVKNGSIAIFCGRKTTASKICRRVTEIVNRKLPMQLPKDYSDQNEVGKLAYLHSENLGPDAAVTQCASIGVFSHHGNTPHGLRLAVEFAMSENLVKFVICTSTLAQGVNLPIS